MCPQVLVADDEPAICQAIGQALVPEGHECTIVHSAQSAADALERGGFDLVIADLRMPGNEELGLWRLTVGLGIPLLVITGYPTVETAVEALRMGVYDYLKKPFGVEDLLERTNRAIEHGRAQRAREQLEEAATKWTVQSAFGGTSEPEDLRTLYGLSPRELEVVLHLVHGMRVAQLSEHLSISEHTVRNHLKSIFRKCDVRSQGELIAKIRAMLRSG
jgi:DNA-binding NarL/FixJ family response regulator